MLNDAIAQNIADEAEEADWGEHVQAALSRPSVHTLSELTTFPKRMDEANADLGEYAGGRIAKNLQDAVSVAFALNRGQPKFALRKLLERRAALRHPDSQVSDKWGNSTEVSDELISHIRSGNPARIERAKGVAGMVIALSVDPEMVPQVLAHAGFKDDRTKAEKAAAKRMIDAKPVGEGTDDGAD